MAKNLTEYLLKIKPILDIKEYKTQMGKFRKALDKDISRIEKTRIKEKKYSVSLLQNGKSILNTFTKFGGKITSVGGKIAVIVASLKVMFDVMKKLTESATEFSNKMITTSSMFVNKDTRSIMGRFGVSGTTATGIQSTLGLMNMTPEEMKTMTPGQMNLFKELMELWTKGINSIDKKSLRVFNESMQGLQKYFAETKMEIQLTFMKTLIDLGPSLNNVMRSIIGLFRALMDMLNSPPMKLAMTVLNRVVAFLVNIITSIIDLATFNWSQIPQDLRNLANSVTNNNQNSQNTYYINSQSTNSFNGDDASMYQMATDTQAQQSKVLSNAVQRTGRFLI